MATVFRAPAGAIDSDGNKIGGRFIEYETYQSKGGTVEWVTHASDRDEDEDEVDYGEGFIIDDEDMDYSFDFEEEDYYP